VQFNDVTYLKVRDNFLLLECYLWYIFLYFVNMNYSIRNGFNIHLGHFAHYPMTCTT